MDTEDPGDPGMAWYCREAESSLVHKLTELMEHRPAIRDQLRGLSTDQLLQVWKMILEKAYGIHYWTDVKLATSTNLVASEAGRRQIREIQSQIREARACYYDRLDTLQDAGADRFGDYHYHGHYGGVGDVGRLEDRVGDHHAGGVAMMSYCSPVVAIATRDGRQETVSIQFGTLPIMVMKKKQCVVDGEKKKNLLLGAAGSLSSGKLVFLGANNLLRNKQEEIMRATGTNKRFILIGSMQVELPT